jgi:hypothetical protein
VSAIPGANSRCPGERNGAWHRSAEAAAEKHHTAPAMSSLGNSRLVRSSRFGVALVRGGSDGSTSFPVLLLAP